MGEMTKLGFVVNAMHPNQICYDMITNCNKYLAQKDGTDICAFWVSDGPRVVEPRFACMALIEAYAFNGITIATSINTLSRVLSYPGPNRYKKIYYYMYDLDYLRVPYQLRNWDGFNQVINHRKVELIVRSESHNEIISSVFRKPLGIVPNFNIETIKELVK